MLTLFRNQMQRMVWAHTQMGLHTMARVKSNPDMLENVPVKKEFDVVPLLRNMAAQFHAVYPGTFENFRVAGVQHMLGTTRDMFQVLREYHLQEAVLCGKSFSTHLSSALALKKLGFTFILDKEQLALGAYEAANQATIQEMWSVYDEMQQADPKKVLFCIDDGFEALKRIPASYFNGLKYKPQFVVGKEQTRGGSNGSGFKGMPFPIIHLAGSLAKRIESPGVARAIADRSFQAFKEVESYLDGTPTVGIIGYGDQGKVIAKKFMKDGYPVIVFDKNSSMYDENVLEEQRMPNAALLWANADIVISCTGVDITLDSNVLNNILFLKKKRQVVMSAASEDREFRTLLERIQAATKVPGVTPNSLKDIRFMTRGGTELLILRGGFPVNFDNSKHSVVPEEIWPTRAGILSSFFMANTLWKHKDAQSSASVAMLCPVLQLMIIAEYARLNPGSPFIHEFVAAVDYLKYFPENQHKSHVDLALQHIVSKSEGELVRFSEMIGKNGLFKVPESLVEQCKTVLFSPRHSPG